MESLEEREESDEHRMEGWGQAEGGLEGGVEIVSSWLMKSIIIKAASSLHLRQNRDFISACLLNRLPARTHKCAMLQKSHG